MSFFIIFTTTSPQSTNIQPDSVLPSTPIILILLALISSTNFSDKDFACLFEFAVAMMMLSAKEEIPLISSDCTFSALLSLRVSVQMSFKAFFGKTIVYLFNV